MNTVLLTSNILMRKTAVVISTVKHISATKKFNTVNDQMRGSFKSFVINCK